MFHLFQEIMIMITYANHVFLHIYLHANVRVKTHAGLPLRTLSIEKWHLY